MGKDIVKKVEQTPFQPFDYEINDQFLFTPITENEIFAETDKLNDHKASG